ncbi:cytochrome P450 family protein [Actinoalloteichus caeruleus]|uniref:cytochrome P450 family protein n=1 Tax=Actinoalloteichus cyanogriseus TaxID=2893586 RepID=UPI003BB881CC
MGQHLDAVTLDPTGRDVYAEIEKLRGRGPAVPVVLPGAVRAWSVTGHEHVRALLADPRVSKDPHQHWRDWREGRVPRDWPLANFVSLRNMFTAYGPEHGRLRRIVSAAFLPRRVQALRPRVEQVTADLIVRLAAKPASEVVDLRAELASPLPISVIAQLFGLRRAGWTTLRECVDNLFQTTVSSEHAARDRARLDALLREMVEEKRREPADDLTSTLLHGAPAEGDQPLSDEELHDTLLLMLGAGFETTLNLVHNLVLALLTHPEQRELVRVGVASWSDAVEEALRWAPPVPHVLLRYAVTDLDVGGTVIPEGDAIMVSYGGAGRDPDQHGDRPEVFDVLRPSRRGHLSFGHGAHFCVGAPLARMEAELAVSALFDRFPGIALAQPAAALPPLGTFLVSGHAALPVFLHPAGGFGRPLPPLGPVRP